MSDSLLRTEKVTFSYSRKGAKVLDEMDIDIPVGKKTAILGSNGAGKSTLFSVLNALNKPASGKVYYKDAPMSYSHSGKIRMRSEVSILFQNPNEMMFKPYVEQDVAYGPENMKLPKEEIEERVQEALFAVGMEAYRKSPIMKLSYGQRKRVTLAGVLAMRPSVLIMDEPTAGLDPQMAYEVMEIAEQLNSSGVTVIMSSHDTDLVYSWADEIRVLNSSKCVYSGIPEPFYEDYQLVQKAGLLLPSVYRMNRTFANLGKCELEPYPHTQSQLSVKISDRCVTDFGVMNVVKVDKDTDIPALLASEGLEGLPIGIYGMSARTARNQAGMPVDFMYNGPENCIRKCLSGEDSVLLCDLIMVDKAVSSADFINGNGYGKIDVRTI